MAGVEGTTGWKTTEADIVRLDDVVSRRRVSFVKIDAEGAELFVLRGAESLLAEQQPLVVCEIGKGLLRERYGIEPDQILDLVMRYGYEVRQLEGGRLVTADLSVGYGGNYVFVSSRYRDRLVRWLA